jgi:hypothetical protein
MRSVVAQITAIATHCAQSPAFRARAVFDAQSSGKFRPAEQCPAYSVPQEIASAVHNKERQDEAQFAQLVVRGVPTIATTTEGQGGMNATYLAALKANGGPGNDIRTASGTIPGYVRPPAEPSPGYSAASLSGPRARGKRKPDARIVGTIRQGSGSRPNQERLPVPNSLQCPLDRDRELQRRWHRLQQRTIQRPLGGASKSMRSPAPVDGAIVHRIPENRTLPSASEATAAV